MIVADDRTIGLQYIYIQGPYIVYVICLKVFRKEKNATKGENKRSREGRARQLSETEATSEQLRVVADVHQPPREETTGNYHNHGFN